MGLLSPRGSRWSILWVCCSSQTTAPALPDIAFDGRDLFVAEKANNVLLVFRDFLHGPSGDIAPDISTAAPAVESVVLLPAAVRW